VVNITPQPLYLLEEILYSLYGRLGRIWDRYDICRNSDPPTGFRTPKLQACNESLYRLRHSKTALIREITSNYNENRRDYINTVCGKISNIHSTLLFTDFEAVIIVFMVVLH